MRRFHKTMNIGAKIKRLRELKNYTQEYMADRLSIGLTAYGNIERDTTKDMSLERLLQIAHILEIDFIEIINFDLDKPFSPTSADTPAKPEAVPDQDDWYGRFVLALVEQCMREKQMMYDVLLKWSNEQSKIEQHLRETSLMLSSILDVQRKMYTVLFSKK